MATAAAPRLTSRKHPDVYVGRPPRPRPRHGERRARLAAADPRRGRRRPAPIPSGRRREGPALALATAPSAAGLVETTLGGSVFIKRHHRSVRSVAGLREEHAFLAHLRDNGAPVVRVLDDQAGNTVLADGEWTYEVHTVGVGDDKYARVGSPRASPSWHTE